MKRPFSAIGNDTIDRSFHMSATFVARRQMPRSPSWLALAALNGTAREPIAVNRRAFAAFARVDSACGPGLIMRFSWGKVAAAHAGIGAFFWLD
jgi:hypothetical protein